MKLRVLKEGEYHCMSMDEFDDNVGPKIQMVKLDAGLLEGDYVDTIDGDICIIVPEIFGHLPHRTAGELNIPTHLCQCSYSYREILTTEIYKGEQGLNYREILTLNNGDKVKLSIKSGCQSTRSHAYARVWNEGWQDVYDIPYSKMKTKAGLHYEKAIIQSKNLSKESHLFSQDRDKLLNMANDILLDVANVYSIP